MASRSSNWLHIPSHIRVHIFPNKKTGRPEHASGFFLFALRLTLYYCFILKVVVEEWGGAGPTRKENVYYFSLVFLFSSLLFSKLYKYYFWKYHCQFSQLPLIGREFSTLLLLLLLLFFFLVFIIYIFLFLLLSPFSPTLKILSLFSWKK